MGSLSNLDIPGGFIHQSLAIGGGISSLTNSYDNGGLASQSFHINQQFFATVAWRILKTVDRGCIFLMKKSNIRLLIKTTSSQNNKRGYGPNTMAMVFQPHLGFPSDSHISQTKIPLTEASTPQRSLSGFMML